MLCILRRHETGVKQNEIWVFIIPIAAIVAFPCKTCYTDYTNVMALICHTIENSVFA